MDPVNIHAKFEVRSFAHSWDNSDWSFGWGLRTPNLGEEEVVGGRRWYHSKELWWVPVGPPMFPLIFFLCARKWTVSEPVLTGFWLVSPASVSDTMRRPIVICFGLKHAHTLILGSLQKQLLFLTVRVSSDSPRMTWSSCIVPVIVLTLVGIILVIVFIDPSSIKNIFTTVLSFNMLNSVMASGMSLPIFTISLAILFITPPTASVALFPWPASNILQFACWNKVRVKWLKSKKLCLFQYCVVGPSLHTLSVARCGYWSLRCFKTGKRCAHIAGGVCKVCKVQLSTETQEFESLTIGRGTITHNAIYNSAALF